MRRALGPGQKREGALMRTTSRMRWNVPNTAVGRIFLVAIALDDDTALGRASAGERRERRERQARLEDVARSVFALPGRPRISRGRPLRCQRGA